MTRRVRINCKDLQKQLQDISKNKSIKYRRCLRDLVLMFTWISSVIVMSLVYYFLVLDIEHNIQEISEVKKQELSVLGRIYWKFLTRYDGKLQEVFVIKCLRYVLAFGYITVSIVSILAGLRFLRKKRQEGHFFFFLNGMISRETAVVKEWIECSLQERKPFKILHG